MKNTNRFLATTAVILICGIAARSALADDLAHNSYDVTKLTSDIAGQAQNTDPVLQNAWGVAFTPGASPYSPSEPVTLPAMPIVRLNGRSLSSCATALPQTRAARSAARDTSLIML